MKVGVCVGGGGGSDLRLGLREGRGDRSQVIAMQEPYVCRSKKISNIGTSQDQTDRPKGNQ